VTIDAAERYPKQYREVLGARMAYVDVGSGDPIVFLHGNPTSSYLWRNVIPHCEKLGRCIAPDLIGMGDSAKLTPSGPDRYRFVEHRKYLDALLDALGVRERVTLVIHDWGSALGFDWANRHRDAVRGIAYMEAVVMPATWADWPKAAKPVFQGFRSPAGEQMVLEQNVFIEQVLPTSILRPLSDAEMNVYRRPFTEPGESRRPMLTWPRQIPIEGEPADVVEIVAPTASGWTPGAEAVHQRRPRRDPARQPARVLPHMAESDRSDREGHPLRAGDSPDEIGRRWRGGSQLK
jgi:haloalkane dehalogenase